MSFHPSKLWTVCSHFSLMAAYESAPRASLLGTSLLVALLKTSTGDLGTLFDVAALFVAGRRNQHFRLSNRHSCMVVWDRL
jgi:hypothetical protein